MKENSLNQIHNNNNNNNIQILREKDDQLMDLQDCGMDKNVFLYAFFILCTLLLYVTYIHDKLHSNAVYITRIDR